MYLAVDFSAGVSSAWQDIARFVPKLLGALVIFVVGLLVARIVARLLARVLKRVGFDRVVERGGLRQAMAGTPYEPADILAKLVYWVVVLFTLVLAFGVFGPNPISDLLKGVIAYLPNVFVAVVILVIVSLLARVARDLLASALAAVEGGRLIADVAAVAIVAVGVFAVLDQLKIAPRIVTGLWYGLLAVVVGSAIVAVGGGGIRTMQRYWERGATRLEERTPRIREQLREQQAPAETEEMPATIDVTDEARPDSGIRMQERKRR